MNEVVTIEKLVHGGQGLGTLKDGRKVFVWNALPGEEVRIRIIKAKKSYAEAIAEEVITPSAERIEPLEADYLATSPWQMMTFEAENKYKKQIVAELFNHEKVEVPDFSDTIHDDRQWNYRNKMEYSFWGDDEGVHLALHQRGSQGKHIVEGSKLAMPEIDAAANALCAQLNELKARAGDLKTIIVRCNQRGETVAALFTKLTKFKELQLPPELKGLRVYHSNPRSPASLPTALLQDIGNNVLSDELLGKWFRYDVNSFFQGNVPVFELALTSIKEYISEPHIVDMYAGVGAIGLSVARGEVRLIELDPASAEMAAWNIDTQPIDSYIDAQEINTSAEKALDYITSDQPIIFDPPRAGLHSSVVERVLEKLPPKIIYLSCNPATHARDLAKLQDAYTIQTSKVYNFFPRTPHIETLAVLVKASN